MNCISCILYFLTAVYYYYYYYYYFKSVMLIERTSLANQGGSRNIRDYRML
jgi:hypothetical protein